MSTADQLSLDLPRELLIHDRPCIRVRHARVHWPVVKQPAHRADVAHLQSPPQTIAKSPHRVSGDRRWRHIRNPAAHQALDLLADRRRASQQDSRQKRKEGLGRRAAVRSRGGDI